MRLWRMCASLAVCLVPGICQETRGAITGLEPVASGLNDPIFVTHAPGDESRLFIAQRGGAIRILDLETGMLQPTPFLTMTGISTSDEGGFLGLAFHPNYFEEDQPGFGKFYVNVTTGSPFTTRIREFTVSEDDPNVAESDSLREILSIAQPQTNHNGGWIGFSPNDDYLYIATGDGGGGNDTGTGHTSGTGNAQDTTNNLLGKMLRIDPADDDFPADSARNYAIPSSNPFVDETGDDEIWSYGLRNPFRASFDRSTGDLWIGDVGQSQREEIDFQPGDSDGGENYGWRLREGLSTTPDVGGLRPPGNVDPVYDYNHGANAFGGTVVTGGYVYRGADPSLQGQYFFLDSRNSNPTTDDNYWMFDPEDPFGSVENIDSLLGINSNSPQFPVSFGEDAQGNLYIAYLIEGEVYRIATNELLPGDYDADGNVDADDYEKWRSDFGQEVRFDPLPSDGNGDDVVNAADYVIWRNNLGADVLAELSNGSGGKVVPEPSGVAIAIVLCASFTFSLCLKTHRRMGDSPVRGTPRLPGWAIPSLPGTGESPILLVKSALKFH